jgi:hypothetical protein
MAEMLTKNIKRVGRRQNVTYTMVTSMYNGFAVGQRAESNLQERSQLR